MRLLAQVALCCLFAGGAMAQRGGGHGGGIGGGIGRGGFRGGFGYGGFGWGGYWPGYYDYYDSYPYASYPYGSVGYTTSPNVTVVYPQTPAYVAHPVMHEYDQYGQEVKSADAGGASSNSNGSPVYLIAFQNHTIQAAAAYWVDGKTLHYVTLQHEEKQSPLETVDRGLSQQLNTERRVQFQLPAQAGASPATAP